MRHQILHQPIQMHNNGVTDVGTTADQRNNRRRT
jgi:hypothetical protein